MRMAGRFSRRVRGWAQAHGVPVIDCGREERKHLIAEEHLKKNPCIRGLFLILVGRAVATVWDVKRSSSGVIQNLEAKRPFINHYSFHIMDPDWGHVTIKMAGHPPFGAQIILNGHEYVACQAREAGIPFTKEGNCFTVLPNLADLARVADTLSEVRTIGRLSQVCERWIYSACLCFALHLEEQNAAGFRLSLLHLSSRVQSQSDLSAGQPDGANLPGAIDRTRARLTVKRLKTIFGVKCRPHRDRKDKAPRLEVVVETPAYDLTIFKLHFGKLTLKVYTKGERVLRFEAIVHNTKELRCGRLLSGFPRSPSATDLLEQFLNNLYCMDASFQRGNPGSARDSLASRPDSDGWYGCEQARTRAVLSAVLALACSPDGFTTGQVAKPSIDAPGNRFQAMVPAASAADLGNFAGKELVSRSSPIPAVTSSAASGPGTMQRW